MIYTVMVAAAVALGAVEVDIDTLAGETASGEVQRWDAANLVVSTASGEKTFPAGELLAVRVTGAAEKAAPAPAVWIELTDGSKLHASDFRVAEGKASLTDADGAEISVSTRTIDAVRFKQQDEAMAAQWSQIRKAAGAGDVIVIRKANALDSVEGQLGEVSDQSVAFTLDGDLIPVKREKVEGLIYFHAAQAKFADPVCVVHRRGGQQVRAAAIELAEGQIHLTSLAGVKLSIPAGDLVRVDYSAGKIRYVSDLEPEREVWTPYLALPAGAASLAAFGKPAYNRSLEGGPLALNVAGEESRRERKTFTKGIALRSRTSLVYVLPEGYRRFTALAGIDDRVRPGGNVKLVISGDDRTLLETSITGSDEPLAIDLDIAGVRRLKILVDYGEGADLADHLDLCDARISK